MGKGLALAFKRHFPKMFEDYRQRCDAGLLVMGCPYIYHNETGPAVINFPTKFHWRDKSQLIDIEQGLGFMAARLKTWELNSVTCPALGCGEGGLSWDVVGPLMYRYLNRVSCRVELLAPPHTPPSKLTQGFLAAVPVLQSMPSGAR